MSTISLPLAIYLLLLHWIGDAICQDGKTAVAKSHDPNALLNHVLIYATVLTWGIGSWLAVTRGNTNHTALILAEFIVLNAAAHWLTDFFTSKLNARLWRAGVACRPPNLHWFFVSVLGDQLIHTSTLLLTAAWVLS